MPIAQLLELWKKIEVEPMEIEVSTLKSPTGRPPGCLFTIMNSDPQATVRGQTWMFNVYRCTNVLVCDMYVCICAYM